MSPSIAVRSRFRLAALFTSALALAACGGGGGGGGDPAAAPAGPAPAPAGPLALAGCMQPPVGVTNTYLNSTRPRREWQASTFLGEATVARLEYAGPAAATPVRAFHYRLDAAAATLATLGYEEFDANGALTRREQFIVLANSTALPAGQSESRTYTVRTLLPAGIADRSERLTVTYEANEAITLPDASPANPTRLGHVDTCRVRSVLESVAATGAATQVSVETQHLAPGLGFVKSYYKPTLATFADRNQTYLTELVATTGALALRQANADTAPSLALCSALAPGLDLEITASDPVDANNAFRRTSASDFGGVPAVAIERLRASTQTRARTDYADPAVGYLRQLGFDTFDSTGTQLVIRRSRSGRPDLRTTAPGASVDFSETFTVVVPANGGAPSTSNDRFRFDGFAKVTTPAGTFDTCKVTFTYGSGDVATETYYHAPNLHWVRLDYTLGDGTRITRELVDR